MGGPEAAHVAAYIKDLLNEGKPAESEDPVLIENRILVKAGYAEAVLERFAKPKNVHTFEGFIRMDVLHGKLSDTEEEIRVCTTWRSKADFEAWASSDSFRGAHARRPESTEAPSEQSRSENKPAAHGEQASSKNSAGASTPAAGGHGHGSAHGRPAGGEGAGPVIGNNVTIYRVAASHLPETAAAEHA
ncbi:hypothetical protein CGZ75_10520 [Paenibacillus herberti]|uniref:ABM domain-containing protein n=1 Tax=Paenibacillus herberti TaxID=1619309 RepID=A0A229P665_9BACL|nr:antibiotic biosynthesis monooxygenase [Paenibacillus herberti]OXM17577.1 hypothetical protein CGZ75_10520 [Paenibacillus herberti]